MGKDTSQLKKQASKGKGPSKYQDAERRQGRRFLFVWLPIIIVVLLFFYASVFDPPSTVGLTCSWYFEGRRSDTVRRSHRENIYGCS